MDHPVFILKDTLANKKIEVLQEKYQLPVLESIAESDSSVASFVVEDDALGLLPRLKQKTNPVGVDFASGDYDRLRKTVGKKQLLAKAVGVHLQPNYVLDATAGLGKDSFYFACLGLSVVALEKNPYIYELIADGLLRGKDRGGKLDEILQRINFYNVDLLKFKELNLPTPDVVYLDPMFPHKKKAALSSKEMELFKLLLGEGDEADSQQMLKFALNLANKRVVVKRPLSASALLPNYRHQMQGKSVRYDIYTNPRK